MMPLCGSIVSTIFPYLFFGLLRNALKSRAKGFQVPLDKLVGLTSSPIELKWIARQHGQ